MVTCDDRKRSFSTKSESLTVDSNGEALDTSTNDLLLIFSFIFGLVFGSFLNVVAYRVPRRESVRRPGSHCPACHHALAPADLVPLFSWLWLGGRCRYCNALIAVRYPVLELATGGLFAATYLTVPSWGMRLAWWFFWLLLMALVGTDLTSMRVPNVLSYPGAAVAVLLSSVSGVLGWGVAVTGALSGFAMVLVIHLLSRGNMGMGDAKLYLTIGAMLGPLYTVESFVFASLSAAVIGLALRLSGLIGRRAYIPFVPHIAIGVVVTVFFGHSVTMWYLQKIVGIA